MYSKDYIIGVRDINKNLKLSNRELLRLFNVIGAEQSDKIDYGIRNILDKKISWILLQWKVKIFRRPEYGEKIKLNTWVAETNRLHMYRQYEILDDNNNILAIANTDWILTHLEKGIIKITEDIINKYILEKRFVFDSYKLNKLKEPISFEKTKEFSILKYSIDFNNHLNNAYYLDIAQEVLPENIDYDNLTNIEIMYKKEITLNDKLKCEYAFENDMHKIVFKNEDKTIVYAIIYLY